MIVEELNEQERKRLIRQQRDEEMAKDRIHMQKTKFWRNIAILSATVVAIVAVAYLFIWLGNQPGKYDDFARCLTEKGFIMAGTDWCSVCKTQKGYFGKSFEYLNYKNCDVDKEWCTSNGITRYPTWILPDQTKSMGAKTIEELSRISNCSIN